MKRRHARHILPILLLLLPAIAKAQLSVPVEVKGINTPVKVRRDARAIPYLEAANTRDLYFAQGYVTASDRLWQMELARRTARGELAEVLGRLALEEDKRHRTFGFTQVAEATWPLLKPSSKTALEAYAAGVNAYLATLTDATLPAEFKVLGFRPRPWQPTDSLLIGKLFAEALSSTWQSDIQRAAFADLSPERKAWLFPEYSPLDVLVVGNDDGGKERRSEGVKRSARPAVSPDLLAEANAMQGRETLALERVGLTPELRGASNNWVVSGRRTASGRPLLANDPHLRATAPNIWYLVHLAAPGLRVAGVSAPGAPGVLLGHNQFIAWGATNLGPDVQDLYAEKFDPANPRRYQTPDGWREATVRREEIKVRKDFSSPATTTETHEVVTTWHGPVIVQNYALQWTALTPRAGDFEGFFEVQTARNWADFTRALGQYTGPTQNFIYADTAGNIGYYGAGAIPIRKSGDGSVPYDGATNDGAWTGLIPPAELPRSYNPPSGIIVTANSRVVGKSYPHFLTRSWFAPVRARRIYDLLAAKPKLTVDDFLAVLGDTGSVSGQIFAREVVKMMQGPGAYIGDEEWQKFLAALKTWDARLEADSKMALLVNETRLAFRNRMVRGILGDERAKDFRFWANDATMTDRLIAERPVELLPSSITSYPEMLQICYKEARRNLARRFGEDDGKWTWGAANPGVFYHPLAAVPLIGQQFSVAPYPQRGAGFLMATPNVGVSVSMRHVSEPGNWDAARFGLGLGQSGDPQSPHWKDQFEDWRNAQPRAFPFTPAGVAQAMRTFVQLVPAP
jgi:penicillin amidase